MSPQPGSEQPYYFASKLIKLEVRGRVDLNIRVDSLKIREA